MPLVGVIAVRTGPSCACVARQPHQPTLLTRSNIDHPLFPHRDAESFQDDVVRPTLGLRSEVPEGQTLKISPGPLSRDQCLLLASLLHDYVHVQLEPPELQAQFDEVEDRARGEGI